MKTYFDSGVLVKAYIDEPDATAARTLIAQTGASIPLTSLHEIEVRNTLRVKVGRGDIGESDLEMALRVVDEDISAGRLRRPVCDLSAIFIRAEALSARHAASTLARSLDLLHVAAALELGCAEFVSLDERQRKVAAREGLKVIPHRLVKSR